MKITLVKNLGTDLGQRMIADNRCRIFCVSLLETNVKIKVYRIFPVALYGRETWPLSFREQRKLWVFEIRVPRRIFGPKREEVTKE
jgi:hypothetical protein